MSRITKKTIIRGRKPRPEYGRGGRWISVGPRPFKKPPRGS